MDAQDDDRGIFAALPHVDYESSSLQANKAFLEPSKIIDSSTDNTFDQVIAVLLSYHTTYRMY